MPAFPGGVVVKNLPANAGDLGSILGLERSPGGGNGNPPQYSCLENSVDKGAWWATVYGVAKSQTQLSTHTCVHTHTHTHNVPGILWRLEPMGRNIYFKLNY